MYFYSCLFLFMLIVCVVPALKNKSLEFELFDNRLIYQKVKIFTKCFDKKINNELYSNKTFGLNENGGLKLIR